MMDCPGSSTTSVVLILILVFPNFITGLEFSLMLNKPAAPVMDSTCGVLFCRETPFSFTGHGDVQNIHSLTIFKTVTAGGDNSGSIEPTRLIKLATVSSTQPKLDQSSNGMKFSGTFNVERGVMLKIELLKMIDCSAVFTCELRGVNSLNESVVYSRSLIQQSPVESNFNMEMPSITVSMLMRLIFQVEKNSAKLENIENKVNNEHDKLMIISKHFERLEHVIENIQEKVCQLELKLYTIDSEAVQNKAPKGMETKIDEFYSIVINASQKAEDTLIKTSSLLNFLNSQNTSFQTNIKECVQELISNVSTDIRKLSNRDKALTDMFQNNVLSLKNETYLESSTKQNVVKTLSALQSTVSDLNSTIASKLDSALMKFFVTECQKNQFIPLLPSSYDGVYRAETRFLTLDIPALYDGTTSGGEWLIIQRVRKGNSDLDFNQDWASFKKGFGNWYTDFWIGNENIHRLTTNGNFELRFEYIYDDKLFYEVYSNFSVAGEDRGYALTVGGYSGNGLDLLRFHNGMKFSTYDRDNDLNVKANCAFRAKRGWWFSYCFNATKEINFWYITPIRISYLYGEIKMRQK